MLCRKAAVPDADFRLPIIDVHQGPPRSTPMNPLIADSTDDDQTGS
jgi:hypothetical protein